MRSKTLLAAFLLSVSLCFVPALGHGEIPKWVDKQQVTNIDFFLLKARVNYMMNNPGQFLGEDRLYIDFYYDRDGKTARNWGLPESVDTKDKVCVTIALHGYAPSTDLFLDLFKVRLMGIYLYIKEVATDMDTDIMAIFNTMGSSAYFYQGEYHLRY